MVQDLKLQINNLASACCSKMSKKERDAFFTYQEERIESGEAYKTKRTLTRRYYKGKNKGKIKDVYNIDGVLFSKLWTLLKPYVYKSSITSHGFNQYLIDEDLSELKLSLFKIMRFFGPEPTGVKLSDYFPLLINNHLTNQYNAIRKRHSSKEDLLNLKVKKVYKKFIKQALSIKRAVVKTCNAFPELQKERIEKILFETPEVSFTTTSIFNDVNYGEDGEESSTLLDYLVSPDSLDKFYLLTLPESLKEASNLIIGGCSLRETSKALNMDTKELKEKYVNFFYDCV